MSQMQYLRRIFIGDIPFCLLIGLSAPMAADQAIQTDINNGDYVKAYDLLLDEIDKHPDDAEALFLLGLCAGSGNMSSLYLKDYIQKYPGGKHISDARGLLIDYYSSSGLLITAGALLETADSSEFSSPSSFYKAALYKQQLGDYDGAAEIYRRLADAADRELTIWAILGLSDCSLLLGNYDSALSGYKRLIEQFPESSAFPFALIGISEAYRRLDDLEKSSVYYNLYRERFGSSPRNIEIEAALSEEIPDRDDKKLQSLIDVEYYVQVGVFARQSNAQTCLKKFRNLRYKTRMVDFRDSGKVFYRVMVGPYATEAEARKIKTELEQSQGEKYTLFIQ